jgi:hypothetical protein
MLSTPAVRRVRRCGRGGGRRGPGVRRALAVAVAVPMLVLSACSSGGDDGGDGKKKDSQGQHKGDDGGGKPGSDGGGDGGSGGGGGDGAQPLSEKQLTAALLKTGDVKGYRVKRNKEDALPPENTMTSQDPKCSAITDAMDSKPEHARTAYTNGVLQKGAAPGAGGAIQQVLLAAYGDGEAEEWFADLKKALGDCKSMTAKDGTDDETRVKVEAGEAPEVGDDAVQFTLRVTEDGGSPLVFTIVRTGGNTASFMSISLSGKPKPVAQPLMEKQHEKLTAVAEK